MQSTSKFAWGQNMVAAIAAMALLVVSHVGFIFLYSTFMDPGHDVEFYHKVALFTGAPFVTFLGPVYVHFATKWVCMHDIKNSFVNGLAIAAMLLVFDIVGVFAAGHGDFIFHPGNIIAQFTKLTAAVLTGYYFQRQVQ